MSGSTIPPGHVLGVFVSPYFVRTDTPDGRIFSSILLELLDGPDYLGTVNADVILPGSTPVEVDSNQNVIGGGVPVYGCCMHFVLATPATLNSLDAFPDVVRIQPFTGLTPTQRQTQMQSIEGWLASKGVVTDLSNATGTREMAMRIAAVLQPQMAAYTTEPFASAFPD